MFLHITTAKYIEEYKVQVSFNNGREGTEIKKHGVSFIGSAQQVVMDFPLDLSLLCWEDDTITTY